MDPNIENWFNWQGSKFIKWYSDYGMNPFKALAYCFWAMLYFAMFYFIFYNEWDKIDRGFLIKRFNNVMDYFTTEKKVTKETSLEELKVVAGTVDFVNLGINEDIILTLPKDKKDSLSYEIVTSSEVLAPVNQGEIAGKLRVLNEAGEVIEERDLVYLESVEQLGLFQRILAILWNWIKSLFS